MNEHGKESLIEAKELNRNVNTPHQSLSANGFFAAIDAMIENAPDESEGVSAIDTLKSNEPPLESPPVRENEAIQLPSWMDGWPLRHYCRDVYPRDTEDINAQKWWAAYDKAIAAAEKGAMILLYGIHGSGKTQIAARVAIDISSRAIKAKKEGQFTVGSPIEKPRIYRKAMEFFNDIRATYDTPGETEKSAIERYASARLVCIDEAHERGEKPFEDRQLTLLIDKRYDAMMPTILITNLQKKDFAKSLSPAIYSRMTENAVSIHCDWESFRAKMRDI